MKDWQPIATAPRDGTRVWMKRVHEGHIVKEGWGYVGSVTVNYSADDGGPHMYHGIWVDGDGVHLFPTPTHWLPSPPSPYSAEKEWDRLLTLPPDAAATPDDRERALAFLRI